MDHHEHDFFVCYPGHAVEAARGLHRALRARGARAFFDVESLRPHDQVSPVLEAAITSSRVVVVLVARTPAGQREPHYTRGEMSLAVALSRMPEKGTHLVAVRVEDDLGDHEVPVEVAGKVRLRLADHAGVDGFAGYLVREYLRDGARVASLAERKADLEAQKQAAIAHGRGKRELAGLEKQLVEVEKAIKAGPPLVEGFKLGDYTLIGKLGVGGFAEVWRAVDAPGERVVAVKIMHRTQAENPDLRQRFLRGAVIMRDLAEKFPREIVRVWHPGVEREGRVFYVMEHLPQRDVESALVEGRIDRAAAVALVLQVAQTLHRVHGEGQVHRDVKPSNILIGEDGRARLSDFDLVRDPEFTDKSRTGHGMGTTLYSAPEVLDNAKNASPRSDVYSLAMTLAFCLKGEKLKNEELSDKAEFLAELECPEAVREALRRAFRRAKDRPESVEAFCASLRAAEGGRAADSFCNPDLFAEDGFPGCGYSGPFIGRTICPRCGVNWSAKSVTPAAGGAAALAGILPVISGGEPQPGAIVLPATAFHPAMRYIPAGRFWMGSLESEVGRDSDEGLHEVVLTRPYLMAETPTTQAQYEALTRSNPSHFKGPQRPVESLTWYDAVKACEALTMRAGAAFALPTEAQWERAARAGSTSRFWSGDSEADLARIGWYKENAGGQTHPVGERGAYAWGLADVHGNVWEWCADRFGRYPTGPASDPTGSAGAGGRVFRGGAYGSSADRCRSACRNWRHPDFRDWFLGFRVVCPLAG